MAKREIAFIVIETLSTWSEFSRSFYLSCTLRTKRRSGPRILAPLYLGTSLDDAVGIAMAKHKPYRSRPAGGKWPRREEPAWHDPRILRTCCAALGCSNMVSIDAALSLPTRVFGDLPVFRNFFGHRNGFTATAARNLAPHYTIPSSRHPAEILASVPFGRPEPLLVDWIDDISIVAELMCD